MQQLASRVYTKEQEVHTCRHGVSSRLGEIETMLLQMVFPQLYIFGSFSVTI
jgi:hypothetical protein